ncbi:hypothetical protein N8I84_11150 [Streptomyces cynarae]|uniref:Lipoprotein n=1 Tax=Streptomyces cynarae TaxID=2981134 RepID=A0ABY6DXU6_9ACTN|nr:hypothetical protein [Streptomyces cynarae]UXY19212.1 hypothetical protein N8I84_11150 [Streptomyces cynarae]
MRTGGVPRPGPTAYKGWLGPALLTSAVATGCGTLGQSDATSTGRAASPSASPRATPDEELCARVAACWSRKVLDTHTHGHHPSSGLPNGQCEMLRTAADAAPAEGRLQNPEAADKLIVRQAREGCAAWCRTGGPSKGPWG